MIGSTDDCVDGLVEDGKSYFRKYGDKGYCGCCSNSIDSG